MNVKILKLILALLCILLPLVSRAQFNFTTNNGSITITRYTGPGPVIDIPPATNGLPVTGIANNAFNGVSAAESILIPGSITNIGTGVFDYCYNLTNITVDPVNASYSSLDGVLFDKSQATLIQYPVGRTNQNYSVPNSVVILGDRAFYGCNHITNIVGGSNLERIEDFTFYLCQSLTHISMPDTLVSIGNNAFGVCSGLTSVTLPAAVTNINPYAFYSCQNLTNIEVDVGNADYSSLDGTLFNKSQTMLIQYALGRTNQDYSVPDGVSSVGAYSFSSSANLFRVSIPAGVSSIGNSAFANCSSLTNIAVDAGNTVYSSADGVLFNRTQTKLIQCPAGKSGTYSIPNTVTDIGDYAFFYCGHLTKVIIPDGVGSIGTDAFYYCTGLQSITIPDTVVSIGGEAFYYCINLSRITIGSGVTLISYYAFSECYSLMGVYFDGNAPTLGSSIFLYNKNATVYHLPGTTGWSSTFGGRPVETWDPHIATDPPAFGMQPNNQFGFMIHSTNDVAVRVEVNSNLTDSGWSDLLTTNITAGTVTISDPNAPDYPRRFYRLRMPR